MRAPIQRIQPMSTPQPQDPQAIPDDLNAPPLTPTGNSAQITLRLPAALVARIKAVADTRAVPYHTFARSWLIAGVRDQTIPQITPQDAPQDEQLNIKIEQEVLDALKAHAVELNRPHHRLARELIEVRLRHEEERLARGEQEIGAGAPRSGMSPYATGGGGVTLEHRVAALYLGLLLIGDGAPELGSGRSVTAITFQSSTSAVDDLVIEAGSRSAGTSGLRLAIAVRRAPSFTRSDATTQKLIDDFTAALLAIPDDGVEHRFALAVAGARKHAVQLAELTALAGKQKDAAGLYQLTATPGRVRRELRERLEHVTDMVCASLTSLGIEDDGQALARTRTWELLCRLSVLMPRVEDPETSDWFDVQNRLRSVGRARDLTSAGALLDRLAVLAGQYAAQGATVNRPMLRRDLHGAFDEDATRDREVWRKLEHLHEQATRVRECLGAGERAAQLHLERSAASETLLAQALRAPGMLLHGDSGVGKSALAVHTLTRAAQRSEDLDVLCLDLRALPASTLELTSMLGTELAVLLSDLAAPNRLLVLDGADAANETHRDMFAYVISAAKAAEITPVVIASGESRQVLLDVLQECLEAEVPELPVEGLSDEELADVLGAFPQLGRLMKNPRSRELLRRPVIIDLLVRSGGTGTPVSDAEAMQEIWAGLVRGRERTHHGSPEAREQVLLALAEGQLVRADPRELAARLDAPTVDVLRRDGLLRPPSGNPWETTPEFAHDELRRYAVARALLSEGDPVAASRRCGAPRWALSATTLAAQMLLAGGAGSGAPAATFERLQEGFDTLAREGHGARWSDVPAEALLGLPDPTAILAAAWPGLRDGEGLPRLLRLLHQRHTRGGILDPVIAEPLVTLLLEEDAPWAASKEIAACLRDWLLSLALADTPAGRPARVKLHDRLLEACTAAEARAAERAREAELVRARRTPEEVARDDQSAKRHALLFAEHGIGRGARRRGRTLPHELLDETIVELLALLARDLAEDGERLLRRIAQEAPHALAPAVEELGTPRALASCSTELLAEITEAYYIDEVSDGGMLQEGIRDHHSRGPIIPMAAFYRGPFMVLLGSDPRRGIAVLNRMLNHAALHRTRTLASLENPWGQAPSEEEFDPQGAELSITGAPRRYIGDEHVWLWYRGTGVGPYPCMSALQACELFCEQVLEANALSLEQLITLLLEGCENLAMIGLIVGLLVRHLENAGPAIDPYLAEPYIWSYEIRRVISETSGAAIREHGVLESERRRWSFREVASWLVLNGDDARAGRLREIAGLMVAKAERLEGEFNERRVSSGEDVQPNVDRGIPFVTTVRNWASALERDRYRLYEQDGQTYVGSTPPEEVQQALAQSNAELARGQETVRILNRYFIEPNKQPDRASRPGREELEADLETVQGLLEDPPTLSPIEVPDAAALVAAAALKAHILDGEQLPADQLQFAAELVLAIAGQVGPRPADDLEYEGSFFQQGADRTTASALPLLLLPKAAALQQAVAGPEVVLDAAGRLARAVPSETRLALARGLDSLWQAPCAGSPCHHEHALGLLEQSIRDCVLGEFDQQRQQPTVELLGGELPGALETVRLDRLLSERFDPAIRGLAGASTADVCVQARARTLLIALTDVQRRALAAHDQDFDQRGTHAMVSARSLLALAAHGDERPLLADLSLSTGARLSNMLRAIAAAAEETTVAAATATRLWSTIIDTVIDLVAREPDTVDDRDGGERALSALAPMRVQEIEFLYRELDGNPVEWRDPLAWRDAIERWLPHAAGYSHCVDSLIALIDVLPAHEQATIGLAWVRALVLDHVPTVVNRSYMLTRWLVDIRPAAEDADTLDSWQELTDALVVAGATTLAGYSE
jgi:predicted DNA binding CopG/RHH family protein